ncbi:TIGR04053 family radical SAM/SPASM domain-containing protein [Paenibacillus mucilaginosus]|uniref:Radical SAM domain protein n=1 Tax=Paenibacillus mucilaginosus (strain KNP414) TaxID=1036673 RepID=F8F9H8_PAEMK|nr:TIGR04053 family radical SAM/SPASM domain-containing protein [Paenibacillus mucilaginosus]AEI43667.1 Radical SAM domain protein [Paenibacillus mucilaginosus KNP414]MCG7216908.1 TIGR04053 family radical SAM/SPASM domain-containing protein [Paenibacillus mucilaginosus]WDM25195.1 TIGR04053 family radical SAM/SPASM domain-containing protein [Paenibacillus mucilaginosus]
MKNGFTADHYHDFPFIVIWEVTRACALKCLHCRAEAQRQADPRQLTYGQAVKLVDQVAAMERRPLFVLTGGDPLMRPDLFELADYAIREKGLSVSMTPSATPRVTREAVRRAKESGLSRWAFSLDGSCADIHDYFRGSPGSYDMTVRGISYLQELGIPIQINTTVSNYNLADLKNIARVVGGMGAVLWSLFFLVPTGRGMQRDMISPVQQEEVMQWLVELSAAAPFGIKTTEAPHYRRVAAQAGPLLALRERAGQAARPLDVLGRAPRGVGDGDGFVFISHTGEVYPSGFLPLSCGNVKQQELLEIYRGSPVMRELRDKSLLKGRCGVCEYKELCGGSRARAYAVTGDYLESDPACLYVPARYASANGTQARPEPAGPSVQGGR